MVGERISRLLDRVPSGPLGYLGHGDGIGIVGNMLRKTMESYLPDPYTDVEIVDAETTPEGTRYKINVTGIFRNVSESRAQLEPVPGLLNMKEAEIESTEVIRERVARKTWQITVLVKK